MVYSANNRLCPGFVFSGAPGCFRYFTLLEVLIASSVLGLIIAATAPLATSIYRSYTISQVQSRFESEIKTAQEWIKRDMTGSSRSDFLLWPQDRGSDIEAISLPVLRPGSGSGGLSFSDLFDDQDRVNWTHTIIYHIYENEQGATQLRRTVFNPRVSDLSTEDRIAQLRDVYRDGHGRNTVNGGHAATQVLLSTLTDYRMTSDPVALDTYAPSYNSGNYYSLGTWQISPGINTYQFEIGGKNKDANGMDIALDEILVSETGLAIDAECAPDYFSTGGTVEAQSMAHYSGWKNNAELLFRGAGEGDQMTVEIYNDSWVESIFVNDEARTDRTEITYSSDIGENVCQMLGRLPAWEAPVQSLNNYYEDDEFNYNRYNIRVLISGRDALLGEHISYSGKRCAVTFKAADEGSSGFFIREAYIMEHDSGRNGVPGTAEQLRFSAQPGVTVLSGGDAAFIYSGNNAVSNFSSNLEIDPDKDYLVSYYVETDYNNDRASAWTDAKGRTNTYIYQGLDEEGQSVSHNIAGDEVWDGNMKEDRVEEELARIVGVEDVWVSYPEKAYYTSRIVDTRQEDPEYVSINWRFIGTGNTDVDLLVRAGDEPDLSDAADWESAVLFTDPGGSNPLGALQGRYVQWRAKLMAESSYMHSPKLRDVELRWKGRTRTVDVAVNVAKGPDRGIFQLRVNDQEPQPAQLGLFFTLGKEVAGKERIRDFSVEVSPRN